MPPLDEGALQRLYAWVDEIPLSRPKRNFTRDFSDGVLVAEIVQHFCPKIIDLHNFSPANATQQKVYNWNTLNQRPFKKLGLQISKADITAVCNCKPNAVEKGLRHLNAKISKYMSRAEALQGQEPLSSMAPAPSGSLGASPTETSSFSTMFRSALTLGASAATLPSSPGSKMETPLSPAWESRKTGFLYLLLPVFL